MLLFHHLELFLLSFISDLQNLWTFRSVFGNVSLVDDEGDKNG